MKNPPDSNLVFVDYIVNDIDCGLHLRVMKMKNKYLEKPQKEKHSRSNISM